MENVENIAEIEKIAGVSPKYYTDKNRQAQQKYREKNREKYNVSQRELYIRLHQNEEWREMFNERSRRNNLIARQRKREELLKTNPDIVIRGRGRPRKYERVDAPVINV